jgi:hypothetical protein
MVFAAAVSLHVMSHILLSNGVANCSVCLKILNEMKKYNLHQQYIYRHAVHLLIKVQELILCK